MDEELHGRDLAMTVDYTQSAVHRTKVRQAWILFVIVGFARTLSGRASILTGKHSWSGQR